MKHVINVHMKCDYVIIVRNTRDLCLIYLSTSAKVCNNVYFFNISSMPYMKLKVTNEIYLLGHLYKPKDHTYIRFKKIYIYIFFSYKIIQKSHVYISIHSCKLFGNCTFAIVLIFYIIL